MEDILANIEHQLCAVHIMEDRHTEDPVAGFVSVIKVNGKPIPPPVMTKQRRLEMRKLRSAAVKREKELASLRRLRLLDKVQTIVNEIEERRSSSLASQVDDSPILVEDKSDVSLNVDNHPLGDLAITPTGTVNKLRPLDQASQSSVLPRLICPDGELPPHIKKLDEGVASVQGSTSSSSDTSLLNQTVVAASDFSKSPATLGEDCSHIMVDPQADNSHVLSEQSDLSISKDAKVTATDISPVSRYLNPVDKSSESGFVKTDQDLTHLGDSTNAPVAAGVRLACSWHKETEQMSSPKSMNVSQEETLPVTRLHLMPSLINSSLGDGDEIESFGERDSYLSLLGEYTSLPMPTGSSHFFSDVSEVPSSPVLTVEHPDKTQKNSAVKFGQREYVVPSPKEEDSSMFLSTSSTLLTNTVGQSCTLPSSLRTISAASTLHDIDDPWNTLIETPVPTAEKSEVSSGKNASRGTPVGQEDSSGSTCNATNAINTKENEFSSPEKRVRRDSYTLDHPSPALLNAQARNEAPQINQGGNQYRSSDGRSLEMTNDVDKTNANSESPAEKESEAGSQNKEPTEENFLRLQLQNFEEMRRHLEQQQKQQLQQLLIEQQQAQIALQQEMTQLERRFRQKQVHGECDEDHRGTDREVVPGMVSVGKETHADVQSVAMPSPKGGKSKQSSPDSISSQPSLSPDVPSKCTSPPFITMMSPTIHSTVTTENGGQTEPFYLEGVLCSHLEGGSSTSPTAVRMPCVGENVQNAVIIGRPNNKFINSPSMKVKFDRVSAVVKGYLTRRIFKTHRIQSIIKTIKDSAAFADKFISETPIKKGGMSKQDMALAERVLAQVRAAQYDLYDIFYTFTVAQRMDLIKQSRMLTAKDDQKMKTSPEQDKFKVPSRPLSAATIKALERRKKARDAEAKLFGDNKLFPKASSRSRPMSAAEGRILKPLLSQRSPARPSSTNQYRPSKYGNVISEEQSKSKDPVRSKVTSQRAPCNTTQGSRSTKTRSPVTSKTKGVRRSLYPIISNPSKKAVRRAADGRK